MKMTRFIPEMVVVALLFVSSSVAQGTGTCRTRAADIRYGPEYQHCSGKSTVEIQRCVDRLARAWDRRLNIAYRRLMKENPQAKQLREAERLWVLFRNANCKYYGTEQGTLTIVQAAECTRSMTAHRALELEEELKGR